ncbi:MAG TPA: NAD(P)-dependent alcohol dehydrogenase [Bacteroidales bacterium]|nr:NAD(P)-dependent alcohol dehydrogenase [Bacteroidales bacterium]
MKAVICSGYGGPEVLRLKEIEKPTPKDNEVLVKIHAAAPTISDCYVRSGKVSFWLWIPMRLYVGFLRPRKPVLGFDLSGEIAATGRNVKKYRKGDQIFAFTGKSFGAYAEYVCLPEDGHHFPHDCIMSVKPSAMTYEEAAAVPSRGVLALYFIRQGNIHKGQKSLIIGASGGTGTYALQLAKYFGAEVTAVCSTNNIDMVRSLGADKVIDYTREDYPEPGMMYDFIFDATPYNKATRKSMKDKCKKALIPGGKYICVDNGTPKSVCDELKILKGIIEEKKLRTVIGRIFSLEELPEAHRYIEEGHKKGHVVVKIDGGTK